MPEALAGILRGIDSWDVPHAAAAVVGPDGVSTSHGVVTRAYPWASVTKPVTAWAALVAVDAGRIDLDEPAGPPGSTVRHLLAHASGLPFDGEAAVGVPGRRRIYSNTGYDRIGTLLAERAGEPFEAVLRRTVLAPLGMDGTVLVGPPSQGLTGTLLDLAAFARELLRPTLVSADLSAVAMTVAFPGIKGVVPGVGTFDPCDWGLGPEVRDGKHPHWMGASLSPATVGHFGGAGTFLWLDPTLDRALAVLTDRPFGSWALDAWPAFSDAVAGALRGSSGD